MIRSKLQNAQLYLFKIINNFHIRNNNNNMYFLNIWKKLFTTRKKDIKNFNFLFLFFFFFLFFHKKSLSVFTLYSSRPCIFFFFSITFIVWLNYRSIGPGGEWIHRLGADSAAPGEHEGRLRPGAKRRPICGAFGADWRPLHPKAHEETE